MNHGSRIGQNQPLALGPPPKQKRTHGRRLPDAHGADVGLDKLHGVINRQPAVTDPPGELIYRWISLSGFSDSRNSS